MMCFNELLGMSFTMCHLTGKQLVLLPVFNCLVKINPTHHLSQTNKLSAGVNLENRGRQVTSTSNLTHRFTEGEKGLFNRG